MRRGRMDLYPQLLSIFWCCETDRVAFFFSLQAYAYESRQGTPIRKWSEWSVILWFDWRILTYGPFFETHVASSCIR